MRGGDVKESGVNREMWLNGAVCGHWAGRTILTGYGGLAYGVICLR